LNNKKFEITFFYKVCSNMAKRPLNYDDLLGNMPELRRSISEVISQNPEIWDNIWSVKLVESHESEIIATVEIKVRANGKGFSRELVIFKVEKPTPIAGFTIQWGSVPHPIIPIIYNWLKHTDTSQERAVLRTISIKEDLIKFACIKPEGL